MKNPIDVLQNASKGPS